jgi:cobalamin-dependent methionine synthase I
MGKDGGGAKGCGGKCLLNSTNYEDGEERFLKVLELAKQYGAGVVIGTIDEEGWRGQQRRNLRSHNAPIAKL